MTDRQSLLRHYHMLCIVPARIHAGHSEDLCDRLHEEPPVSRRTWGRIPMKAKHE